MDCPYGHDASWLCSCKAGRGGFTPDFTCDSSALRIDSALCSRKHCRWRGCSVRTTWKYNFKPPLCVSSVDQLGKLTLIMIKLIMFGTTTGSVYIKLVWKSQTVKGFFWTLSHHLFSQLSARKVCQSSLNISSGKFPVKTDVRHKSCSLSAQQCLSVVRLGRRSLAVTVVLSESG